MKEVIVVSHITVEEAMTVGALTRATIIAGQSGIRNPIEHVTVLEIPDAEEWFKGNELIITAFYHIKDDEQLQLALLEKMKHTHASALALCYPGLHYRELSEKVLQRADELQIPIIEIPRDVPYIDIISPVVQEIQKNRSQEIKQMLEIQNRLTEWLALQFDYHTIIYNIGEILDDSLLLLDNNFKQLASYHTDLFYSEKELQSALESAFARQQQSAHSSNSFVLSETEQYTHIVETIYSTHKVYGYLCVLSQERLPPFKEMLYHSVAVSLALYFSQEEAIQNVTKNYQQTMIINWLNGQDISPGHLEKNSKETGYDLSQMGGIAVVAAVDHADHHMLIYEIERNCASSKQHDVMIIPDGYQFILLLPRCTDHKQFQEQYYQLFQKWRQSSSVPLYIAYHQAQKSILEEGVSLYKELRHILHFKEKMPALPYILYAPYLPLFTLIRSENIQNMFDSLTRLLEPLVEYDCKVNADFLITLEYFLFYPDQQELPDILHIHRNTLNYRKQRIIEILQINPFENPYRLQFELAILLYKM